MSILVAQHLKKSFFDPKRLDVLSDISLILRAGESIAIRGRSGEGKTTLLHILGTLETPDSGNLTIANIPATKRNACRLRQKFIGFIFQAFNLLEDFTTLDNVLMPARVARLPTDQNSAAYQNAINHLREVDLLDRAQTRAKLLSGGERQRVAIARALCNDPALILADEPSGNLDRGNAQRIGELLMRCVKSKNKSLILVTHDLELASLCDHQYLLKDGCLS
jgi:lipoprotein-releasing system ATP-binding protein